MGSGFRVQGSFDPSKAVLDQALEVEGVGEGGLGSWAFAILTLGPRTLSVTMLA